MESKGTGAAKETMTNAQTHSKNKVRRIIVRSSAVVRVTAGKKRGNAVSKDLTRAFYTWDRPSDARFEWPSMPLDIVTEVAREGRWPTKEAVKQGH